MNGHVYHGFIADVYEPWLSYEGTEWGDQMRALHEAYGMGEDYAGFSFEQMSQLEAILRDHLEQSYEDGWLTHNDFVDHIQEAENARADYNRLREYWKERATSFKAIDSFEAAEKRIPDWMRQ